jgi:Cdc6-like AAA superfamily ATPase
MIFPVFEIVDGNITSLKGEVSSLYKIVHSDLTQMNNTDLDNFYENLHLELKSFKDECFYKFYYINDILYLNTDDPNISRLSHKLELITDPLSLLFHENDVYRDLEVFDDYIVIGHRFIRLLNFYDLPSSINNRFLENFGDHILCLKKFDSEKVKKKLNFKRKIHFSLSQELLRNIESEKAFIQNENLLEEVTVGSEIVFSMEGWFLVTGENLVDLNVKTQALYEKAKLFDLKLLSEGRGLAYFFSNIIPGVNPTMKREHLVPAKFISGLLGFPNEDLYNQGFVLHSRNDRPLMVDLFHPDNIYYNALITGTLGQGKSVLANNILFEEVNRESKAVVLDLGNSFKKTVDYLGGVSLPTSFNPLQFKDPIYLKAFVLSIVDDDFLSATDKGRLFEVLSEIDFNKIKTFKDFINLLENHFKDIKYFFNELESSFNNDVYHSPDLLYVDLTLYPDRIKAPLIIYLIEHFKHLEGRRIFILDECWNLLENQGPFIAESFRTFRKHGAAAIAISQNLEDFLSTPLGRVIYQTTFFKFIFRQETNGEFLTEHQKEMLLSVQSKKRVFSEFLLLSDFHQKICRFYSSPFKFYLFNSDKSERDIFNQFRSARESLLDFREILHQYIYLKTGELI